MSAAASVPARNFARRLSNSGEELVPVNASRSVVRYLGFSPSALPLPWSAASYLATGSRPPALVSNVTPCRFIAIPPPDSVKRL